MNKKCARCDKTVYPTEELKCLDKVWHKICFKCKSCGMTLNMRNYKGMDKEPYCEAHIPKAKATTVAVTPELRRIAENTKLQSNIKYHEDFERSKGKFTQVADDPEMQRIKANTRIISNVAYHGELERKANMEMKRTINENGFGGSGGGQSQQQQLDQMNANVNSSIASVHSQQQQQQAQPQQMQSSTMLAIGKISDYEPQDNYAPSYAGVNSHQQTLIYSSDQGAVHNPPQRHIGSVHDIDPLNHNYGSLGLGRVYKALYDYEAQDTDEVSFLEGDLIVNVRSIDSGWMTGEVQRTGETGMLPANYVKIASI